jgi:RNA polymerase sigma factor (sigma-70 family)
MQFPATQWTLLAQATLNGDTAAGKALEEFFLSYRGPVIAMLRRRGLPEARVEDLTQDFFLQLMKNSAIKRADPAVGPFRNFLCGMLTKFLADDADWNGAAKRGGGVMPLSLDAGDGVADEVAETSPDTALQLDFEWALQIVARALENVRKRWQTLEKPERFAVLRLFLPGALESITQQEAAARLGLTDEAFRKELHRVRESFRAAIRAEVAATVSAPGEVADEMRHLARVLQSAAAESEKSLSQAAPFS